MPDYVLIETEGEAIPSDFDRLMKALTSAPEWKPGTDGIIDHRRLSTQHLSYKEMSTIREIVKNHADVLGKGRIAFVVGDEVVQGFSNMYALINGGEVHREIDVFKTIEEAVGWVK